LPSSSAAIVARALPSRTLAGLAFAAVTVASIAFFTYRALDAREVSARQLRHATDVLSQLDAVMGSLRDAETAQRGYLLTGEDRYLAPHAAASVALPEALRALRRDLADGGRSGPLDALGPLIGDKIAELDRTIALRKAGDTAGALALVRTDRGQATMERIRAIVATLQADERRAAAAADADWQAAVRQSSLVTWSGSSVLIILIGLAGLLLSRDHRARETQIWLRAGQASLAELLQGEQRLDVLGERVLTFLCGYLGAPVGAVFVRDSETRYRRVAGHALAVDAVIERVDTGDSLIGQVARSNRLLHVTQAPAGYLQITSALGRASAVELLLAPASVDGVVYAVIELGFFTPVREAERELLGRASEVLGVAVRSAQDRTQLESLLDETQQQREALQTQQEELRVSNEELEEQSRALRESQARLESQQTELEQINAQLEEQTSQLEEQKDSLSEAQANLEARNEELERANQYKNEFLANMSHELRTPLNSSLILAKLLADNKHGNLTPEQVKFAETISSAGQDLLALINDILDLSKVEAGKVEVTAETVHVGRAIDAATRIFEPIVRDKGLAFAVTIEPGTPETIVTDAQRFGQILRNLLSNAVKFTERGEVTLRVAAADGDRVAFAVRDTGIGIAEHQQAIIFEAFRQADGSTHRRYGGTGLGLSISRDLARLLGGDLGVHSAPGEGSVFTLVLPRTYTRPEASAEAHVPAAAAPAPRVASPRPARPEAAAPVDDRALVDDPARLGAGPRRILVVEDDAAFAAILRDLAHELTFHCVIAPTAAEGLAAAVEYQPSAILLDMNLPDQSGLGVLDQLKRDPRTRHIPVHVLSVADYSHEALERGAIGYALKPIKRDQLIDAIHQLEHKFSQTLRRVLVVEDDARQRESIRHLLAAPGVVIVEAADAAAALAHLATTTFDCMVMDLSLPDLSGYELLEQMSDREGVAFPPVIVYTGRSLTVEEEQRLGRYSRSIIIKDARSPERLLDEVTLFLHQIESTLPADRQRMLKVARDREAALDGRRVLVVEDDARNIFALASILEPKGVKVEIARNGREALETLARTQGSAESHVDLVLMDIMMPEMDGISAMREIRKEPRHRKLPIIALTAKAMKDDQERCLAAGANDYIAKPLDVERLLSLVRVWMPGR
jgi:CheY-like chemotaxis protein/CHASE3 domain sensor protein